MFSCDGERDGVGGMELCDFFEDERGMGSGRHTSPGFGTKDGSGVVGSSLLSSTANGSLSIFFSVSSSGVRLLSNSSKVSLDLMSNLGRSDCSDCSDCSELKFREGTGVTLGWTVPLGSLDADGRAKLMGGGISPLGRDRGLLGGVAVFAGAWFLDNTGPLLRRAALLEVGRMKLGIWDEGFCVRVPMVLRRGRGGFESGCMSARCVIWVFGFRFGIKGSVPSCWDGAELKNEVVGGGRWVILRRC